MFIVFGYTILQKLSNNWDNKISLNIKHALCELIEHLARDEKSFQAEVWQVVI